MSIEVIKCPACAATLDCDGKSEFIKCGHCGNTLRLKITAKPSEPQEMKYLVDPVSWIRSLLPEHTKASLRIKILSLYQSLLYTDGIIVVTEEVLLSFIWIFRFEKG